MGIKLRYGVAVGILAALFGILGPVSAQASHALGTPVAAASHHSGIANRTVLPNYRCGYGHYDHYCCDHYGGYNRYCCGYHGGYNHYCCGYYGGYNHYCYDHYGHYDHYCCYGHYGHHGHHSR